MKKAFSISLSIIMVAAVLHFAVAIHYCGGKEVASTISLSGKTASCGMENHKNDLPLTGTYLYSNCCKDEVIFYGIDNNWAPSFSVTIVPNQILSQIFNIPAELSNRPNESLKLINSSVNPPGVLMSTNVDLSYICNFRI
jgi:hypothetical protein